MTNAEIGFALKRSERLCMRLKRDLRDVTDEDHREQIEKALAIAKETCSEFRKALRGLQ